VITATIDGKVLSPLAITTSPIAYDFLESTVGDVAALFECLGFREDRGIELIPSWGVTIQALGDAALS